MNFNTENHDVNSGISALTYQEFNERYSNVSIVDIEGDIIYIEGEVLVDGKYCTNVRRKGIFITDMANKQAIRTILMTSATTIERLPANILLSTIVNIEMVDDNYWQVELNTIRNGYLRGMNTRVIIRFTPTSAVEGKTNKSNEDQIHDAFDKVCEKLRTSIINTMVRYRRAQEGAMFVDPHHNNSKTLEYRFDNDIIVTESIENADSFGGICVKRKVTHATDTSIEKYFVDEVSFYHYIGKHI